MVGTTTADIAAALEAGDPARVVTGAVASTTRRPAFLFPGQGAQSVRMTAGVYDSDPAFRAEVDRCCALARPHLDLDLRDVLYAEAVDGQGSASIDNTWLAQPALFVVEYALARLWIEAGVEPQAMIGHSVGEYVAACLSGVFGLEEALGLVAARGRLMQRLPVGAMLAVAWSEEQLAPLLGDGDLELAAVNRPDACVVSGSLAAIAEAESRFAEQGIAVHRLRTSHAFHSVMMEPVMDEFAALVRHASPKPPVIPYVSNVTGTWITEAEATDPDYWARHLRRTVRFAAGVEALLSESDWNLIEVGPGQTLTTAIRRRISGTASAAYCSLGSADANAEFAHLLGTAGSLWTAGTEIAWDRFAGADRSRRVGLPSYPFERRRYWVENGGAVPVRSSVSASAEPSLVVAPNSVPPRTRSEQLIADLWSDALSIAHVGVDDNFFDLGGDSIIGLQVTFRARALGLEITPSQLLQHPTVAALATAATEIVVDGASPSEPEFDVAPLVAAPEQRFEPFPLTEVQEAYWIGRGAHTEFSNVASHVYQEFESAGVNVARLEDALNGLISRHAALRSVTTPDGRQRVLDDLPRYRIEVQDLRGRPRPTVDVELETLRARMSHQVLPTDRWPLFEVRASLLDGGRVRLHVSVDILFTDAWSLVLAGREVVERYLHPRREPAPLEISFRDYVLAERRLRGSALYANARRYWLDRVATLPPAPALPLTTEPEAVAVAQFTRRVRALDGERWERLKARTARAGLTPSAVLCAAYADVLAAWSASPRFCLNLPLYNRLPLHPHVGDLLGDFTSIVLLEVDAEGASFEQRAQRIQKQLWQDLDHRHFGGVQVIRELARCGGAPRSTMPIVFTSLIFPESQASDPYGETRLGAEIFGVSQTPQVLLDEQVFESGGKLMVTWDSLDEAFPEGLLDRMFDAHARLLARLADDEQVWSDRDVVLVAGDTGRRLPRDGRSEIRHARGPSAPSVPAAPFALSMDDPPIDVDRQRTPTEERLLAIWAKVLGGREVAVTESLFALGGDSITATRLAVEVRTAFEITLPLRTIFDHPTVAELAGVLDTLAPVAAARPLIRVPRTGPLPASAGQRRLWFEDQFDPGNTTYNYQEALRLVGPLDVGALERSLIEIGRRHEILRTTFVPDADSLRQCIADAPAFDLSRSDLRDVAESEQDTVIRRTIAVEASRPFDLSTGPLLRVHVLRRSADEHVLIVSMHHIVTDAWSLAVLVGELRELYEADTRGVPAALPDLPLQFADYAVWEQAAQHDPESREQLAYWKNRLHGYRPGLLGLPEDHPDAPPQPDNGARQAFTISPAVTVATRAFCRLHEITLFVALMATWQTLLHYYSGQEDVLVGTPTANRGLPETRGLIGFFVNTLAFRTSLAGDPSFLELVGRVRTAALEAFGNERPPYDRVVEEFWRSRSEERVPLFRTWFVLQNVPMPELQLGDVVMTSLEANTLMAVHDLKLIAVDHPASLRCAVDYRTHLFEPATIARMAVLYETLLREAVARPAARLSDLVGRLAAAEQQLRDAERDDEQHTLARRLRDARRQVLRVPTD